MNYFRQRKIKLNRSRHLGNSKNTYMPVFLFSLKASLKFMDVFIPFQLLIGVQDEDSYQKSGRALLRGVWHKTNRPRRRSLPSWSVWLMTFASKPWSWTVKPYRAQRRRLTGRPRKAKSCTEIKSGV
jgi:hypothetical protein